MLDPNPASQALQERFGLAAFQGAPEHLRTLLTRSIAAPIDPRAPPTANRKQPMISHSAVFTQVSETVADLRIVQVSIKGGGGVFLFHSVRGTVLTYPPLLMKVVEGRAPAELCCIPMFKSPDAVIKEQALARCRRPAV
jgi:hypothetical protein